VTTASTLRFENLGIVVEDLKSTVEFFLQLGMELEGETTVEGGWAERVVGLENMKVDVAMVKTPDGQGRLELMSYHTPEPVRTDQNAPPNALGLRRILFKVDNLEETLTRLRSQGADLIGEVAQFEDTYKMCYLRGPEGIMIALAEQLT
jgi:catechol 2,3-dioxygenase-like lactoylglutathione lyase family enzyme